MSPAFRPVRALFPAFSLCLGLGSFTTEAQTGKLPAEAQQQVESAAARFVAAGKAPGVSVAVVRDGEFVWAAGFGMADLENAVPATAQTVYRLASISKALTGTAAMVLSEQSGIDFDAPVQKYCPGFPEKPWPLTTRQVLGHIGGIRHYNVPETPYSASQTDPEVGNTRHFEKGIVAGLEFFQRDPLIAQPGTHFHYSTQGYTLAACAIEGAAGRTYADYVRTSVLAPAGMVRTQPDDRVAIVPLRTRYYSKDSVGGVINAGIWMRATKSAAGGSPPRPTSRASSWRCSMIA